jgi:hypothetical protein
VVDAAKPSRDESVTYRVNVTGGERVFLLDFPVSGDAVLGAMRRRSPITRLDMRDLGSHLLGDRFMRCLRVRRRGSAATRPAGWEPGRGAPSRTKLGHARTWATRHEVACEAMIRILPELVIGPLLVGGSTLACRRWGAQIGGLVSAFPAVVGPVLLITAQERGPLFTALAANGTLLGLVALSGFVLAYARVALRARWGTSLIAGWACAALLAVVVGWSGRGLGFPAGLGAATISLILAHRAMPRATTDQTAGPLPALTRGDIPLRMVLTALLVGLLATAAGLVGPLVAGMLAALPVLASVLAVFTHRRHGPGALVALLRGMLVGMAGFVGFCAVVGALVVPAGVAPAFTAAALTAVALQVLVLDRRPRLALRALSP